MGIASSSSNPESRAMALAKAKEIVASAPLVVFSKTSCPFCVSVKQLFEKLGASYKAIELNVESDGPELQNALKEWTGQRTVPNVFINGKHIGGCDDTMALNSNGKLVPLLTESGAIASSASSNPALAKAKEVVASAPLVVFSKTSCPFCVSVKQLFEKLGASYKAIELDVESDGPELQNALKEWTGQRTVPNVFINGKHIGGCDDTMALNNNGKLVPLLTESGAIASSASSNPALAKVKEVVASAPLVVFSKTSCPFCVGVKQLFEKLGASYKAIELDVESDLPELQNALEEWTGQRTVPNVFINGKHIGGCDDTMALNNNEKLVPLLTEAGAIAGSTPETTATA